MPETVSRKITDGLLKSSLITQDVLQQAIAQMESQGTTLRTVLVKSKKVDEKVWIGLISQEFGIPSLNLSKYKIAEEIARVIPEELAKKHQLIAISKMEDTLMVAVADPPDVVLMDDLKRITGYKIKLVLTTENEIQQAIDRHYSESDQKTNQTTPEPERNLIDPQMLEEIEEETEGEIGSSLEEMLEEEQQGPIIRLVDTLITEGLKRRASDIHIEPYENQVRVRYRVDGKLQEASTLPKKLQNAMMVRLKLMAGADITETRIPIDGRFKIKFRDSQMDFRVSFLPIRHGYKVVMRILDRRNLSFGLEALGLVPETLVKFQRAIARPFGMVLLTGPTGSGKTTTLYSILAQLNVPEKNIITIEDPVEYQIDGITQIQTKTEIVLTFANGLRSILRQSPDVVMVGEIRDFETADIAIKASLTGQLVLSTLHTNDSAGAVNRLMDMGVEPFLIASSVVLVGAQRLCRRICVNCKEPFPSDLEQAQKAGVPTIQLKGKMFYHGKGCDRCYRTGYRGRVSLLEVLVIDDLLREMIVERKSSDEIKHVAMEKQGLKILREDGFLKCFEGITTLEEVLRITTEE